MHGGGGWRSRLAKPGHSTVGGGFNTFFHVLEGRIGLDVGMSRTCGEVDHRILLTTGGHIHIHFTSTYILTTHSALGLPGLRSAMTCTPPSGPNDFGPNTGVRLVGDFNLQRAPKRVRSGLRLMHIKVFKAIMVRLVTSFHAATN